MKKRIGLYLQGGGAKGAFQAGALKALAEKAITFQVLVGTSIGAINGMTIFYRGLDRMETLWLAMLEGKYSKDPACPVLETKEVLRALLASLGREREPALEHFYVNYVRVEGGEMRHEWKDLAGLPDAEVDKYVRASSLLPNFYRWQEEVGVGGRSEESIFKEKIASGQYDGYLLDGGLVNNNFPQPFLEDKVDLVYAIVFDQDFTMPQAIFDRYKKEEIIVIKPDFHFSKDAAMEFNEDKVRKWLQAGYIQAKSQIG